MQINDEKYYQELCEELRLKQNKVTLLMNEIQFLQSLISSVENGATRKEVKERLEHNPFDDFDFFGWNKRTK